VIDELDSQILSSMCYGNLNFSAMAFFSDSEAESEPESEEESSEPTILESSMEPELEESDSDTSAFCF